MSTKFREVIAKIPSTKRSPGNGYYTVYIVDDVVIKRYTDKDKFENDIEKHMNLDRTGLVPRMLSSFYTEDFMYLIVEKVDAFGADIDTEGRGGYSTELNNLFRRVENTDKFKDDLSEITKKLRRKGYDLFDTHAGNFGYRGCLWGVES
jgi:hypothetical protein